MSSFFDDYLSGSKSNRPEGSDPANTPETPAAAAEAPQPKEEGWDDDWESWEEDTDVPAAPPVPKSRTRSVEEVERLEEFTRQLAGELELEVERLEEFTRQLAGELKDFLVDFCDPQAIEELNEDLSKKSFQEFISYYSDHPDLADYTLNTELPRNAGAYCVRPLPPPWISASHTP